ncbi:MAG: hypothetical protein ACLFPF_03835 [Halanaerobiales bacterium]
MKKIIALLLMLGLVLGMGSVVMAQDSASADVDVNVTISEYYDVWFDTPDTYKGLFGVGDDEYDGNQIDIGEAGIYISDGKATRVCAVDYWAAGGATDDMVVEEFYDEGQLDDPQVELFKVDANTVVDVTLSSDFDGWLNAPTLFRVSSSGTDERINGIGDWEDDLAVIGNEVAQVDNEDFHDIIDAHNDGLEGLDPTFTIDFADTYICHGPLEFHVNGALWLPKISQVAADEYSTELVVTVAASDTD